MVKIIIDNMIWQIGVIMLNLLMFSLLSSPGAAVDSPPIHQSPLPFPATDDILVSQPFVYDDIVVGANIGSYNNYVVADDFILTTDHSIDELDFWITTYDGLPESYILGIQGDTGEGPDGTFQWQETQSDFTHEYTCPYPSGGDIWNVHISITNAPVLTGPGTYWFCVQAQVDTATYWILAISDPSWNQDAYHSFSNGSMWQSISNRGCFFILQGSTALERMSWADIKASF